MLRLNVSPKNFAYCATENARACASACRLSASSTQNGATKQTMNSAARGSASGHSSRVAEAIAWFGSPPPGGERDRLELDLAVEPLDQRRRSEERRVGKECRARWGA